jgi:hypothetical protein
MLYTYDLTKSKPAKKGAPLIVEEVDDEPVKVKKCRKQAAPKQIVQEPVAKKQKKKIVQEPEHEPVAKKKKKQKKVTIATPPSEHSEEEEEVIEAPKKKAKVTKKVPATKVVDDEINAALKKSEASLKRKLAKQTKLAKSIGRINEISKNPKLLDPSTRRPCSAEEIEHFTTDNLLYQQIFQ